MSLPTLAGQGATRDRLPRVYPSATATLAILAWCLIASSAHAADTGGPIFRDACSQITAPVTNKVACWEQTTPPTLKYWNGSAWVALTGPAAGVTSVTGTAGQILAAPPIGAVILSLVDTAVTPGPYGSATQTVALTFDAKGRATSAANVTIAITPSQITCTSGIFQGGSPAACGPLNQAITNSPQTIDYKVYRSTGDPNPLNVNAGASILQTWTGAGADGGAFLSQVDLQATASGVVSPSGIFTGCRTAVEGSDCWGLIATINPAVTLANPQGHAIGALLRGLAGPNVVGIGIISEAVSGHASSGLEVGNTVAGTNEFLKGVWVSAAQDYGLLIGATAGRSIPTNPIALILADGVTKPWYLDATGFQTITRTTAAAAQALLLAVNSGSSVGDGATLDWQHSASERSARIYARALSTNVGQLRLAIGNNAGGYTDVLQVGAGVSVGTATDPGAGKLNVLTEIQINGTAFGVTNLGGLGTGVATFLATPSSANLRGAVTDETGGGLAVFNDTPTFITPVLGVATGTSVALTALSSVNAGASALPSITNLTSAGYTALFRIGGESGSGPIPTYLIDGATTAAGIRGRRSGGTFASPAATAAGVNMFVIEASGYETTGLYYGAAAARLALQTVSTHAVGDHSTLFTVLLTPVGSTTLTTSFTITSEGAIRPKAFVVANISTVLAADGDMGYCSDCTIASPCAGGGSGAIAKRLNAVNVCN